MSTIVLDSNVLLATVLPDEPLTQRAKIAVAGWVDTSTQIIAPRLFRAELVAVIRKAVYQKRISHTQGKGFLLLLLESPVTFVDDDELLLSAYELAAQFNLPRAYDAQYLALAQRFDVPFWTADQRLFNSISEEFGLIRWLGDF